MTSDFRTLLDRVATGPSFEEAMSTLVLGLGHMASAPPTTAHVVERLRLVVSALDGVATRAARRLETAETIEMERAAA